VVRFFLVRPQRRLLGGESAVEGDRISPLEWLD